MESQKNEDVIKEILFDLVTQIENETEIQESKRKYNECINITSVFKNKSNGETRNAAHYFIRHEFER